MVGPARCLVHPPAPGARNMAVDEALLGRARAGTITVRFYRWESPCLSFGRNQAARDAYDFDLAARRGIEVVRRPTGGRAVYHHRELTYSVTAPSDSWGGLRETYRRINRALAAGLAKLGVRASPAERLARAGRTGASGGGRRSGGSADGGRAESRRGGPGPADRACFRDPLPGELVASGRKLVGSAQWRSDGALLQHGSLLLRDEQEMVDELRLGSGGEAAVAEASRSPALAGGPRPLRGEGGSAARPAPAVGLSELLDETPGWERLVGALRTGFEGELGVRLRDDFLSEAELRTVAWLTDRHRSPEWLRRR